MADETVVPAPTEEVIEPEVVETPEPAPTPTEPTAAKADDPFERPFVDPATLPDEIKSHWKAMHRAHNKKLEELRAHKADLDMLARFRSDPAYAREILQFEAQRLGLPITGQQPAPAPASPQSGATNDLVEAVKARLDPSLHWMAESLANGAMAAAEAKIKPLLDEQKAQKTAAREAEWGALSGKLTEQAPGWEAHEGDMTALLDWLRSPSMKHEQFGDKLTFLYNAVTGNAQAKAAAIRAMGDAARNATRTGQTSRATLPNIGDRVMKATSAREAVKIAAEEAERELRERGITIPD